MCPRKSTEVFSDVPALFSLGVTWGANSCLEVGRQWLHGCNKGRGMEQCPQMSPSDAKWSKCGQLCPAVLIGVVELRWPCLLRADSGWCWEWGCVCSYRVPKHPATGVTGTGNNEGASLISEPEPFLIRWKTMLSFLCSLSRSCTSNLVLKLTCLCFCSALSQLQL